MKLAYRNKFTKEQVTEVKQRPTYFGKMLFTEPTGFWYGIKNSWKDFLESEDSFDDNDYMYNYELKFKQGTLTDIHHQDPNKVLVIKSAKDYNLFSEKYLIVPKHKRNISYDWTLLKSHFAGLELRNFDKIKASQPKPNMTDMRTWFLSMLDASSGVIWNVSVISELKIRYTRNGKEWIPQTSLKSST